MVFPTQNASAQVLGGFGGALAWEGNGIFSVLPTTRLPLPSFMSLTLVAFTCTIAYLLVEQAGFWRWRMKSSGKFVPGPRFPVPLLGGLVKLVMNPYEFWEQQCRYSFPGFSYNSLLGQLMIFVTDAELSRKALSVNDENTLLMAIHPAGKDILGENNLAFMHGPRHKAIRKSFLSLFTRKALSTYVELQDVIIRRHISSWLQQDGEFEIRPFVRDMNHETSLEVFVGPYLEDLQERKKVSNAFRAMTEGFLAFPVCLPGTKVWRAKQGRLFIVKQLTKVAARSKAAMKSGVEPQCLMDFWALRCLEEAAEALEKEQPPPPHTLDEAMADTVMDFLFASQDASTASLVWSLVLLAEHPDVLQKVRAEQTELRADLEAAIDGEVLYRMTYTRQVVKELLRFRPPAPMVPLVAQNPFPLGKDYSAPKGALLMPSLINACRQGFSNPDTFDPDRFSPERKEDSLYGRYFLTFGCGPHYCAGKDYAINHLTAFIAVLSSSCEWTRRTTPNSHKWLYLPTIYPADSLITIQAAVKPGSA